MAAWKNLTPARRAGLNRRLKQALADRGIDRVQIVLGPSGLPGRYRLYVTADDFGKLDYSERLAMLSSALQEAWPREDQLRLTLLLPLAPDELPAPAKSTRARVRHTAAVRTRRRTA